MTPLKPPLWFYALLVGAVLAAVVAAALWPKKPIDTAPAVAAQASGQNSVAADSTQILDRGARRDSLSITVEQGHARDILANPGASASVDDALGGAGAVRRLCQYAAAAGDPACAEVRSGDSGLVP